MSVLDGVRVLEIADLGLGPFCVILRADLGAGMTLVEGPRPGSVTPPPIELIHRGKRSMPLAFKQHVLIDTVRRIVERSDALIERMRPSEMERLERLRPAHRLGTNWAARACDRARRRLYRSVGRAPVSEASRCRAGGISDARRRHRGRLAVPRDRPADSVRERAALCGRCDDCRRLRAHWEPGTRPRGVVRCRLRARNIVDRRRALAEHLPLRRRPMDRARRLRTALLCDVPATGGARHVVPTARRQGCALHGGEQAWRSRHASAPRVAAYLRLSRRPATGCAGAAVFRRTGTQVAACDLEARPAHGKGAARTGCDHVDPCDPSLSSDEGSLFCTGRPFPPTGPRPISKDFR